jgi:hypothetical protein
MYTICLAMSIVKQKGNIKKPLLIMGIYKTVLVLDVEVL